MSCTASTSTEAEHARSRVPEQDGQHDAAHEDDLHDVQRAEHEAADSQPDRDGRAGRAELQRCFQERDRDDHAQPRERERGGGLIHEDTSFLPMWCDDGEIAPRRGPSRR